VEEWLKNFKGQSDN
jgi:hypothetical protein